MKPSIVIITVILATYTVALAQQAAEAPDVGAPVFHSLKLGLPLGTQMAACHIDHLGDGKMVGSIGKGDACFYDPGPIPGSAEAYYWAVDIFRGMRFIGAHEHPTDKRESVVYVLIPAGSRLVAEPQ